jgi:hypothetical protein
LVLLIVHIEQPIPRPVAKERKCTIQVRRYTAVKNQRMVNNHNDDILHKAADHKEGGSVNSCVCIKLHPLVKYMCLLCHDSCYRYSSTC